MIGGNDAVLFSHKIGHVERLAGDFPVGKAVIILANRLHDELTDHLGAGTKHIHMLGIGADAGLLGVVEALGKRIDNVLAALFLTLDIVIHLSDQVVGKVADVLLGKGVHILVEYMLGAGCLIGADEAVEPIQAKANGHQRNDGIDQHTQQEGPEAALLFFDEFSVTHCQHPPSAPGMWWEPGGYPQRMRSY